LIIIDMYVQVRTPAVKIHHEVSMMKNVFYYDTEIGRIGIADNGNAVTDIFFDGETAVDGASLETPLIRKAAGQIREYLAGTRRDFDLPLEAAGTEFQKRVWEALQTIPYGETRSYGQIAAQVGNSKACRAVGMANNKNPISIVVPCHRVIGADGRLVGYGGGLHIKERLLKLEKNTK